MAGSGYQQDSNQLTPGLYRVVLTMTSSTNYPVYSGTAGTTYGAVNPYDWTSSNYTNATTLTSGQALVLAQGNLRWERIMESLAGISDCRILDVVVTGNTSGTDATTAPTSVTFTVEFGRDAFVLGEYNKVLQYNGATANGTYTNADGSTGVAYNSPYASSTTAVTTTSLAVQDIVTAAIILNNASAGTYTRFYRVYNPAQNGDSEIKVTITPPNSTASNIYGTVGVTQISGTTLAGSPL
jgi:roadblock/LC7 domain-containing protein